MSDDRWMAHSLLSVPLNLGLLEPIEVARAAEQAYHDGAAPLAAVEGFVRQVIGWRDYIWHLYWYLGRGLPDAQPAEPAALHRRLVRRAWIPPGPTPPAYGRRSRRSARPAGPTTSRG